MSPLRVACFTLLGTLTLAACGGSSTGGASTSGTTGAGGSGPSGTGGAMTTGTTSATTTGQGGAGGAPAPVMACSEIPAADCFSSYDCPSAEDRCENRGTADLQVPCCVPGPRGAGKLGDVCQGENDCASALCLGDESTYHCTDKCTAAADCPSSLPKCITIAFSGSPDKFCTP